MQAFFQKLSRKKPISKSIQQSDTPKTLRWHELLTYGIAATVGGGIYATVGRVAHDYTGPAVIISTIGAGILSLLTAFCYLELAAMIPASGSSYVYGYSYLGEFLGFMLGWIATLEYAFAGSVTGTVWAEYIVALFKNSGCNIPEWLYKYSLENKGVLVLNILACGVVLLVSLIVLQGVHFGAKLNNVITTANILVIMFIIIAGSTKVTTDNYTPFFPESFSKIFTGAAEMIYSYIGFDTICNLSSDAVSSRHLQIGVIGTVSIATILYIAVALVLTGMVPFDLIPNEASLSSAFSYVGMKWGAYIVQICALSMTFATLLACLIGQPRIFEMMAKDGLLPPIFYRKSEKTGLTTINMVICCLLSAILALLFNIATLVDMIAVGALIGFSGSAAALIMSRLRQEEEAKQRGTLLLLWLFVGSFASWPFLHKNYVSAFAIMMVLTVFIPFTLLCLLFAKYHDTVGRTNYADPTIKTLCPLMPLIPCLTIIGNAAVIPALPWQPFVYFAVWVAIGCLIYFCYGYWHAGLNVGSGIDGSGNSPLISEEIKDMKLAFSNESEKWMLKSNDPPVHPNY